MNEPTTEHYQAKWNEYQLGQLAALASQRVFHIPRFQREFVWNDGQIKLLCDSVARNYPIGSLLLLAENRSTLQLAGRPIDALLAAEETGRDDTESPPMVGSGPTRFHVLDGQQRLTSLVRVFANMSPKKVYYVDLAKMLESFGPEATEEADWLISRSRPRDPKPTKERGRLVRADVILDVMKTSLHLDEFIDEIPTEDLPIVFRGNDAKEDKLKRREAKATLVQVLETIRNYRVPAIVIDRESPLSAICRIFETINSTGRKLTTFDLAVAGFYPEPDLRERWDKTLERYPRIKSYALDGERVLQLLVLRKADREKTNLAATRNAIMALTKARDYVEAEWDGAARALDRALEWAEAQGARPPSLPQEPVVVSIACLLHADGAETWLNRTAGAFGQLQRWYFAKILQSGAKGAASNYNIGRDLHDLLAWYRDGRPLPATKVRLSPGDVATLLPSDVRYKAIFSLLVRDVKSDLRTQGPLGMDEEVEDHHLFPRSFRQRHKLDKRKLDGIANRIPVSKATNIQISDRPPAEYLQEILRSEAKGPLRSVLAAAGFEPFENDLSLLDQLQVGRFDMFIAARANRLLEMIERELGMLLDRNDIIEREDD